LVVSLPLQKIGTVHAGRRNLDEDLVTSRTGDLHISKFEHLWRARFARNDRFHAHSVP
jgi:hypothetical protein